MVLPTTENIDYDSHYDDAGSGFHASFLSFYRFYSEVPVDGRSFAILFRVGHYDRLSYRRSRQYAF